MDSTNPGTVTVANQAFGVGLAVSIFQTDVEFPVSISPNNVDGDDSGNTRPVVVNQTITTLDTGSLAVSVDGDDSGNTRPIVINQPITTLATGSPATTINGGSASPLVTGISVTQDRIASQIYGVGPPINVYP